MAFVFELFGADLSDSQCSLYALESSELRFAWDDKVCLKDLFEYCGD